MSETVTLKVTSKTKDGQTYYEGTVAVPGLKPAKLVKKKDNDTKYTSESGVKTSARNFAKKYGFELEVVAPAAKKAAKKTKK